MSPPAQSSSLLPNASTGTRKRVRSTMGCGNCKKRKLKCDETRPTCARCKVAGLECPGYPEKGLRWSSKHEVHKTSGSHAPSYNVAALRSQSSDGKQPKCAQGSNSPGASRPPDVPLTDDLVATTMSMEDGRLLSIHGRDPSKPASNLEAESGAVVAETHGAYKVMFGKDGRTSSLASATPSIELVNVAFGSMLMSEGASSRVRETSSPEAIPSASYGSDSVNFALVFDDARSEDNIGDRSHANEWTTPLCAGEAQDISWGESCANHQDREDSVTVLSGSWNAIESSNRAVAKAPPAQHFLDSSAVDISPSAHPPLLHLPTLLVEYYFHKVCRDCSTFDSALNPFRTMISSMRGGSASIEYVIRSLSAAKLADDMPRMKVVGIEAQWRALEKIKNECLLVTELHEISDEVLYTTLLLGMTTSWHERDDLGLEYLALANRIVAARAATPDAHVKVDLEFFQNALKYWNMIGSLVSENVQSPERDKECSSTTFGPPSPVFHTPRVMPHPWAGVSPTSVDLFGRILQLIRKTCIDFRKATASSFSRARISGVAHAISSAESLELECWSVSIPSIDRVEDTGDLSTPAVHHVLTGTAYLLAALLHIYMAFPDVLESRIQAYLASEREASRHKTTTISSDVPDSISKSWLWARRLPGDPSRSWLRDIGFRIVECLEAIDVGSSTRVVHPPLLLSVATALTLADDDEVTECLAADQTRSSPSAIHSQDDENCARDMKATWTDTHTQRCRNFIISRLEIMRALMRFHAIDNVLRVVKEVWNRADSGRQDISWMDVMSDLHCETLFG